MNKEFIKRRGELENLLLRLKELPIPKSTEWGGADVVITTEAPKPRVKGFYPEPRYVVTQQAAELSWLFEQLRDTFSGLLDGEIKIEFFGRLANAALSYQSKNKDNENQKDLLFAVLHEAFAMLDEMEEGNFEYLSVALGNTIADDFIERAESRGFLSIEETKKFFEERGLKI